MKKIQKSLNKGVHKIEAFGQNLGQGMAHVTNKLAGDMTKL